MKLNVLYVEDQLRDWERVEKAVKCHNRGQPDVELEVHRAKEPSELHDLLSPRCDVVVADVYFRDEQGIEVDRLDEIINTVEEWGEKENEGRGVPIIAYTGQGKGALQVCLDSRESLFDIWDKHTATPLYVVWRLAELAKQMTRLRPDSQLQSFIRQMQHGARWHEHVVKMAAKYNAAWTERDQIERAGECIEAIAFKIGVWERVQKLWQAMVTWEQLGRAVSRRTRGHARHVINVFWLGYYLLHHELLRPMFEEAWKKLLVERRDMGAVMNVEPMEGLSDCWFYAGLLHDVAACIEKSSLVCNCQEKLLRVFGKVGSLVRTVGGRSTTGWDEWEEVASEALHDFDGPSRDALMEAFQQTVEAGEPDHGVLAAAYWRVADIDDKQAPLIREATRAMALHNLIGKMENDRKIEIQWIRDPISCLLLLCDQLQTWERERNDEGIYAEDDPQRAELADLTINEDEENANAKAVIEMIINYIAAPHVGRVREIRERVRNGLETVLREKPNRTLKCIREPWPFRFHALFELDAKRLITDMKFGYQ